MYLLYINVYSSSTDKRYAEKLKSQGTRDKELFNFGWKVDELSRLSESGRRLKVEVTTVLELLKDVSRPHRSRIAGSQLDVIVLSHYSISTQCRGYRYTQNTQHN